MKHPTKTQVLMMTYAGFDQKAECQPGDYVIFDHCPHVFDDDDLCLGIVQENNKNLISIKAVDGAELVFDLDGGTWEVNHENYRWSGSFYRRPS